ncbi:MAG: SMC-Scp complex subunit ScpB [Sedimentisphaerales bacterium]|nr:SMC-Scp complex subunit ScpB [Sedimentisphaerales bacterium]
MTQEPRETLTDEPEAAVEVTNEPQDEPPVAENEAAENPIDRESAAEEPVQDAGTEEAVLSDEEETAEVTDQEDDADEEAPDEPLDEEDTQAEAKEQEELGTEDQADAQERASGPGEEEPDSVASDQTPHSDAAAPVEDEAEATVESVIEAILFASDEPLTHNRIANIVETTGKQVRQSIKDLNARYESNHHAFRIEQIAGGYQMLTLTGYNHWLRKMLRARSDTKLSPAAMETLAIIAYKQPIIRADIEAIRGVAVGEVIRSLMYKGLVKIVGRAEVLGRPMLYGTTKKFLGIFGLNSLKDLPKVEELKNPDR